MRRACFDVAKMAKKFLRQKMLQRYVNAVKGVLLLHVINPNNLQIEFSQSTDNLTNCLSGWHNGEYSYELGTSCWQVLPQKPRNCIVSSYGCTVSWIYCFNLSCVLRKLYPQFKSQRFLICLSELCGFW